MEDSKLVDQLFSKNFWVQLIATLLLGFEANNILIDKTPEEIIDLFSGENNGKIVIAVILFFLPVVSSVAEKIRAKEWTWDWVNSSNFRTSALAVVSLIVGALLDEQLASIVLVILGAVFNIGVHTGKPTKVVQLKLKETLAQAA